ncbi:uncharacterized protein [Dendropsophus ebraccatus]|uniref:uncharacterized protein n=1 Tax=Dendropsophus ebraccatus TaxID=150705 RepID=UPI003831EE27
MIVLYNIAPVSLGVLLLIHSILWFAILKWTTMTKKRGAAIRYCRVCTAKNKASLYKARMKKHSVQSPIKTIRNEGVNNLQQNPVEKDKKHLVSKQQIRRPLSSPPPGLHTEQPEMKPRPVIADQSSIPPGSQNNPEAPDTFTQQLMKQRKAVKVFYETIQKLGIEQNVYCGLNKCQNKPSFKRRRSYQQIKCSRSLRNGAMSVVDREEAEGHQTPKHVEVPQVLTHIINVKPSKKGTSGRCFPNISTSIVQALRKSIGRMKKKICCC